MQDTTHCCRVIGHSIMSGLFEAFHQLLAPALEGRPGAHILDVASASGEPAATLAAALPNAHVVSTDVAPPYLELGQARAQQLGLVNISFETADGEDLHQYADDSFDAVAPSASCCCQTTTRRWPNFSEC